ncbi:hypothetical protein Syn7502_02170 [Synechococcus sp. PCC 7502]|uniref:hypothetical protein n=1 Tax=Synechococcus sp. PCC 7502 TaxID=1173263 RepID=UPI00029FBA52|nr:hypothetical protein [Synechococcus sp. PCC 7502]AFY74182.1 hypothetical protein Syn7502_02170 [Synechococcus sp. PCC 7502]
MSSPQLETLLNRDYEIKIGEYISQGFEVLKQYFGSFIGFFFLTALITLALNLVPILGGIASSIIGAPLGAGFTFVGLAIIRKQPYVFNDFFKGLSNKYFLQIFLLSLVGGAITALGFLLLIIPGIYIAVSYAFALQIAIDWELDFWEALETSRKFVSKNWFSVFGFLLVLGLINLAGALVLGIGLFFTAPLTICSLLVAYNDILGNKPEPELSDSWG